MEGGQGQAVEGAGAGIVRLTGAGSVRGQGQAV